MKRVMKETISTLIYILFVLCITWFVINFVGQRTDVDGSSMEPTLSNGDNLIVDKISYRFSDPERFDIIVFPFQYGEDVHYIKRIIGLPGETVRIDEQGVIYIKKAGETEETVLTENYGLEIIHADNRGRAAAGVTLGEDEYFVLGDNRNNSSDSRLEIVGNIKREDIVGRAWVRIWPFHSFGVLEHQ